MVEPEDASGVEALSELLLDMACLCVVTAVGVEVALCCGEDGAASVGFDAAALKLKVKVVLILVVGQVWVCLIEPAVDLIVKAGAELASPGVEAEV